MIQQALMAVDEEAVDARALRDVFAHFPSGVVAICAIVDQQLTGMAASSFTSVSIDPPLVSFCVDNASSTWPKLRGAPRIGLSVLGSDQENYSRQLSSRDGDRFLNVPVHTENSGAALIGGATAWFECSIEGEVPAGDHHIILFRIVGMKAHKEIEPLVFHRSSYRSLAD